MDPSAVSSSGSSIDDYIAQADNLALQWYTTLNPPSPAVTNPPATLAVTSQGLSLSSGTGSVAMWIGIAAVIFAFVWLLKT